MSDAAATPSGTSSSRGWTLIAGLSATVLVLAVYANGMQGPFILDDVVNILLLPSMALSDLSVASMLEAASSTGNAYPDRPLARLSFALNHYMAGGFEVLHFKVTNIVVHLLSAALIWGLASRLLRRRCAQGLWTDVVIAGQPWWRWAALIAAVLWAVHPLHVSTVLYIVQRMTSLSGMFVLAGLLAYVAGRERLADGRAGGLLRIWLGVCGFGLLGLLCKENAVLLPFWVALVELVFFERTALDAAARRGLAIFHAVVVVVPAIIGVGLVVFLWDDFLGTYEFRPYDMADRLLTQARALWFYLALLAVPSLRSYGLYHDDFAISTSLTDPWTTGIAVAAWAVVIVLAILGLRRRSLFSFAVFWYLIGHTIESSILSLEMVFEHRNYVPTIGPMIAFAALLVGGLGAALGRARVVVTLSVAIVVVFAGIGFTRANIWENKYTLIYFGVRNHPDSARYLREWAGVLSEDPAQSRTEIFGYLQRAAKLKTDDLAALYDMARFVDWKLDALGEPPAWGSDEGAETVDPFTTPLGDDVAQMRSLARSIDRELTRRADSASLSVNAAEIGRHIERCLVSPDPACKRLVEPATRWTGLVAANPRLVGTSRSMNAIAHAKLLAYQGDLEGALESMSLAESITPDGIMIRFEKAALMLQLGRLDDAERALQEAEDLTNWGGTGRKLLESMREKLAEARQGTG